MKTCPSCKEEIKDDANVCRYCGQEQDTEEVREMYKKKQRYYYNISNILLGILVLVLWLFWDTILEAFGFL